MFYIGNICVENRVGLAPMAGISNASYIKLVSEMGLGFAITELISAEAIFRGNKKTLEMLNGISDLDIPVGVQIFGGNPRSMALAAKYICDNYKVSFIDINMGCPVLKVAVRSCAGSSLLKNPSLAYDIVKSVVDSVSVPVTVKIRSGWDSNSVNAVEIAKFIEKAGASMITVHPRTRAQGYSGLSDWNIIRLVKENVSIPVIGNGDIKSYLDASRMLEYTGCDGVMIGRAAIGNPWIIRDCVDYLSSGKLPSDVSLCDRVDMIKRHIDYMLAIKPVKVVVLEMRMHISKYLKGIRGANYVNNLVNKASSIEEIYDVLDMILKEDFYV